MRSLDVIVEDNKITIAGFYLGEVFEYTEKLWHYLRTIIPKNKLNSILLEISALSNLKELKFEWSVSIEVLSDLGDDLLEYILSSLLQENFLTDYSVELI